MLFLSFDLARSAMRVFTLFFTFQPEWFFTQLLTWAKDHTDCLSTIIQPALWDSGYESVNANVEFLRCKSSHSV